MRNASDIAQIPKRGGARAWLLILGAISLSTGILNFLPVPLLDDGRAAMLGVEIIRRENP